MTPRKATTTDAKLREIAAYFNWELSGFTRILWPRSRARLALLRQAWEAVEPEARAGTLTGALAVLNYGKGDDPDWRPYAYYLWTAPEGES